MNDIILETRDLTKTYKYTTALDHVNLTLRRGRIYGFIGNNGAGKTTLMRSIMGLTFPDSGELFLFGETGTRNLERNRSRIGALIEQAVGYDYLTARQNMVYRRIISKAKGKHDMDGFLERLSIHPRDVGKKTLKNYSVGMRQRYGVAAALLGEPEFLVLDEPTSGLDPAGTRDLRELFLELNREHSTTMLISSHILGELYQIAMDFIFINRGKILCEMTHEELETACKGFQTIDEFFLDLVAREEGRK